MKRDLNSRVNSSPSRPSAKSSAQNDEQAGATQQADEQLQQRVRLFLSTSSIPALRRIRVNVEADTVVLAGQVNSFYEKQLAAEFTRRVAGVIHVVDLIDVRSYAPQAPMTRFGHWRPAASSVA